MRKKSFEIAPVAVEAYRKTGKLVSMTGDTEIVPGIKSHVAYRHSPGHQIYVVESNGQKLLIIGDMIHVGAVEFERPTAAIGFDDDLVNAEKVRIATLTTSPCALVEPNMR